MVACPRPVLHGVSASLEMRSCYMVARILRVSFAYRVIQHVTAATQRGRLIHVQWSRGTVAFKLTNTAANPLASQAHSKLHLHLFTVSSSDARFIVRTTFLNPGCVSGFDDHAKEPTHHFSDPNPHFPRPMSIPHVALVPYSTGCDWTSPPPRSFFNGFDVPRPPNLGVRIRQKMSST